MKYKNLLLAYSIEILFGITITLLVFLVNPNMIALLALFALRPFILKKEEIDIEDKFWCTSYKIGKYALFVIAVIIILFFVLTEIIIVDNTLFNDGLIKLGLIVPLYLFIHGITGLIWEIKEKHS